MQTRSGKTRKNAEGSVPNENGANSSKPSPGEKPPTPLSHEPQQSSRNARPRLPMLRSVPAPLPVSKTSATRQATNPPSLRSVPTAWVSSESSRLGDAEKGPLRPPPSSRQGARMQKKDVTGRSAEDGEDGPPQRTPESAYAERAQNSPRKGSASSPDAVGKASHRPSVDAVVAERRAREQEEVTALFKETASRMKGRNLLSLNAAELSKGRTLPLPIANQPPARGRKYVGRNATPPTRKTARKTDDRTRAEWSGGSTPVNEKRQLTRGSRKPQLPSPNQGRKANRQAGPTGLTRKKSQTPKSAIQERSRQPIQSRGRKPISFSSDEYDSESIQKETSGNKDASVTSDSGSSDSSDSGSDSSSDASSGSSSDSSSDSESLPRPTKGGKTISKEKFRALTNNPTSEKLDRTSRGAQEGTGRNNNEKKSTAVKSIAGKSLPQKSIPTKAVARKTVAAKTPPQVTIPSRRVRAGGVRTDQTPAPSDPSLPRKNSQTVRPPSGNRNRREENERERSEEFQKGNSKKSASDLESNNGSDSAHPSTSKNTSNSNNSSDHGTDGKALGKGVRLDEQRVGSRFEARRKLIRERCSKSLQEQKKKDYSSSVREEFFLEMEYHMHLQQKLKDYDAVLNALKNAMHDFEKNIAPLRREGLASLNCDLEMKNYESWIRIFSSRKVALEKMTDMEWKANFEAVLASLKMVGGSSKDEVNMELTKTQVKYIIKNWELLRSVLEMISRSSSDILGIQKEGGGCQLQ